MLDAGLERCPHGLPLWVDLGLPGPIQVTPTLVVGDNDGTSLRLLAGPALGSGRSPWTSMLLELLEELVRSGDRVADVGTGTGILALRAAQLGARRVDAVDLSGLAVAVARRNVRVNGLGDTVTVLAGTAERLSGHYDVVIISLGDVSDLGPALVAMERCLRPGGVLLASPARGADEADTLRQQVVEAGLEPLEPRTREDWTVWIGRKPGQV